MSYVVMSQLVQRIIYPVTVLSGVAQDLSQGNFTRADVVTVLQKNSQLRESSFLGSDEVELLIENFIGMSAALRDAQADLQAYNRRLSRLVSARTRELGHKNQVLQANIAEIRGMQEKLIVQEKMAALGELTAGIAHEIKNPLNFITNFSQLSSQYVVEIQAILSRHAAVFSGADQANVTELLVFVAHNSQKVHHHGVIADRIIRNMLMHVRSSDHQSATITAQEFVTEQVLMAQQALTADQSFAYFEVEFDFPDRDCVVSVYPQELGRVLLNLVNNACSAMTEKMARQRDKQAYQPKLLVAMRALPETLELCVRDNGCGIPVDQLRKVFEPFFSTKVEGKGTGLGLSISYDLITKDHQGEMAVASVVGEYTAFTLSLPVSTRDAD